MEHDTCSEKKQEETTDTSSGSVESETFVVIREDESSKPETDSLGTKELTGVEQKADSIAADSVIEVRDIESTGDAVSGEPINQEKVCRICHLSSENLPRNSSFIQLGCSCKDELGISHKHCAAAWFGSKGNRRCEICGETAKNVADCDETRVAVESRGTRLTAGGWSNSDEVARRRRRCCRDSIFAALLIAFILPWFFTRSN